MSIEHSMLSLVLGQNGHRMLSGFQWISRLGRFGISKMILYGMVVNKTVCILFPKITSSLKSSEIDTHEFLKIIRLCGYTSLHMYKKSM